MKTLNDKKQLKKFYYFFLRFQKKATTKILLFQEL